LAGASKKTNLCFVMGPIGKDGTAERKHADLLLHSVIKHVLERDEFKYKVKRADEDADPGMIGDRVVSDIINADLVVADLTDLNPNAFYELGIRHSTEKPTIHIARQGTALPFDNVAHRTIFVDLMDWHSIEAARARLAESAKAVNAPDYKVSNPITQANASFKMRQSEDPRERLLAQLQERLTSIEGTLAQSRRSNLKSRETVRSTDEEREHSADRLFKIARRERKAGMSDKEILEMLQDVCRFLDEAPTEVKITEDGYLEIDFPGIAFSTNLKD
jgi:hypothetical protein